MMLPTGADNWLINVQAVATGSTGLQVDTPSFQHLDREVDLHETDIRGVFVQVFQFSQVQRDVVTTITQDINPNYAQTSDKASLDVV